MPPIRIQGLTKSYKDGPLAVDHVDLEIPDGEFMVLVGPSGCGKSTMLRMLAGIVEATSGTIHIGDRDVTRLDPRKRDIAMVFQSYALYPHLTVRDNLGFGLKLRGAPKAEIARRVERGRAHPRARRAARPQARRALGRPAPARRDGPRDRARAARVPDGRAALQPRREAARLDARAAQPAARAARHHHGLRHARPGRGDDARRSCRGPAPRRPPAVRHAAGTVQAAGEHVRRGVHRLSGDEPRRGRRTLRRGPLRRLPHRARRCAAHRGTRDPRPAAPRPRARRPGRRPVLAADPGARAGRRGARDGDADRGGHRRPASPRRSGPRRARRSARGRRAAGG